MSLSKLEAKCPAKGTVKNNIFCERGSHNHGCPDFLTKLKDNHKLNIDRQIARFTVLRSHAQINCHLLRYAPARIVFIVTEIDTAQGCFVFFSK